MYREFRVPAVFLASDFTYDTKVQKVNKKGRAYTLSRKHDVQRRPFPLSLWNVSPPHLHDRTNKKVLPRVLRPVKEEESQRRHERLTPLLLLVPLPALRCVPSLGRRPGNRRRRGANSLPRNVSVEFFRCN